MQSPSLKTQIRAKENSQGADGSDGKATNGKSPADLIASDSLLFMQSTSKPYGSFLPHRESLDDQQQRVAIFIDGSNLFYPSSII